MSRSVWLGEVITGGVSADLIIHDATEASISALVSLLYGDSLTVACGVFAGIQALCHCLGLNSWLSEMVTATEQEEQTTGMDPCDENDSNRPEFFQIQVSDFQG